MTARASEYDLLLQATLAMSAQHEPAQLARVFVQFVAHALAAKSAVLYDIVPGTQAGFNLRPCQGLALDRGCGTEREGSAFHTIAAQMLARGDKRCHVASPKTTKVTQLFLLIEPHAQLRQWLALSDVSLPEYAQLACDIAAVYRQCHGLLEENCADALTGLYNRKPFVARMHEIIERQTQGETQIGTTHESLLGVIDIDRFKRINDEFGHVIGDEVLLLFSRLLRDSFRGTDLVFRFGGEEFVVLLPNTTLGVGATVFERCREKIAAHVFPQVEHVTASIGFTSVHPGKLPMTFVDEADRALYRAKHLGRNRVCNFMELEPVAQDALASSVELF
jgi:diguanylate cyclase (GGDEF)-like protein